jgi:hypothetical protein
VNWAGLRDAVATLVAESRLITLDELQFWHRDTARLGLIAVGSLLLVLIAMRLGARYRPASRAIVLPALLRSFGRANTAWLRHLPLLPFAVALPFALLALADPYTAVVSREVSFPGRRISLMIDASTSMQTTFASETLNTRSRTGPAFFTTIAAAERFVRLRMKGQYRDLMALVEFGNQAYVITPFTNDYDNILLSIALISDPVEFSLFPDRGTVIARAIDQSLGLFRAFDFLEASGNLMVIFTDGEDVAAIVEGRKLDDILASAVQHKVPLYFVRTNYKKALGEIIPDALWKTAVEKTGGKFYAVSNEGDLLRAIEDIDRQATGTVQTRVYTSQQPRFDLFALGTVALWTIALAMKLGVPQFQKLP